MPRKNPRAATLPTNAPLPIDTYKRLGQTASLSGKTFKHPFAGLTINVAAMKERMMVLAARLPEADPNEKEPWGTVFSFLAKHYHWSHEDIIKLTPAQAEMYLEKALQHLRGTDRSTMATIWFGCNWRPYKQISAIFDDSLGFR
jgi:hypothetical protein